MIDQTLFHTDFDVRTSFVSLVDHLPAEIIRKLWLIQTLDIQHNALKQSLDAQLIRFQELKRLKQDVSEISNSIKELITKLYKTRSESLAEAKSIASSITLAKLRLDSQHLQLQHDHKIYLSEIEMRDNLASHAQRSNKRTTSTVKNPLRLKLSLKTSFSGNSRRPSPALRPEAKSGKNVARKRGRPPLKARAATPAPAFIVRAKRGGEPAINSVVVGKCTSPDENEDHELYCICNRESFGDMIACENPRCPKEWFHYSCVGIVRAPRGKWLCPLCDKKKM